LKAREIETGKIDKYLVTNFFPDMVSDDSARMYHFFIPYKGDAHDPVSLDVTQVLDPKAWEAAQNWT
jgi:hypothetical protein